MQASYQLTVGRLLCGRLRDYLEARKLVYPDLRFHEGRGWIERQFTIAGTPNTIREVVEDISVWKMAMDKGYD